MAEILFFMHLLSAAHFTLGTGSGAHGRGNPLGKEIKVFRKTFATDLEEGSGKQKIIQCGQEAVVFCLKVFYILKRGFLHPLIESAQKPISRGSVWSFT